MLCQRGAEDDIDTGTATPTQPKRQADVRMRQLASLQNQGRGAD